MIAARSRHRAQKIEAVIDAKARALEWLATHEDSVLDRLIASDDDRVVFATYRLLKSYASGSPTTTHTEVSVVMSPEMVLREIQTERARRRAEAVAVRLLPEPEPPAA